MTWADVSTIAPFAAAIIVAALVIVTDIILPGRRVPALFVAFVGLGVVAVLVILVGRSPATAFDGAYVVDDLTTYLDLLFVAVVALTLMVAPDYLEARDLPLPEFVAVLLFALSGVMLISASGDLLVLFLGLELMVLPGYLLAGFAKHDSLSTEGAIKYFLLGSFSSAIFLFGLAFIWGLTGTTRIAGVSTALGAIANGSDPLTPGYAMALAFMTTGVAFKIAAVPFHYWTPDAYQGSPTPVTGYLSIVPKVGAFALILRLFVGALGPLSSDWNIVIVILAAVTMTLGNLVALSQDSVKRMLAYSSIAHTGYMLVGLAAWSSTNSQIAGLEGLLYYGAAYAAMNLGAFAVVAALQRRTGISSQLESFAGLGGREPFLAVLMTLFLLSLVGIPPTAGFFAKAYIILSAVEAGGPAEVLAVLAVLNAAVAAFYYLRVVVYMFMRDPKGEPKAVVIGRLMRTGLIISAFLTVIFGLLPEILLPVVANAARALTQ
jgi:NADH-quinone oxidoreductase subunit N